MVCYDRTIFENLESEGAKISPVKLKIDKISSWNMILISNDFCHKRKMYNFDPYNVLLYIDTNIPVLLMTASVLQGHIYIYIF